MAAPRAAFFSTLKTENVAVGFSAAAALLLGQLIPETKHWFIVEFKQKGKIAKVQ